MLYSGLCRGDRCPLPPALTHRLLLMQAVATSLDALAVGVGLRAGASDILTASQLIALVTLLCCLASVLIGRRFGDLLGKKAEAAGGAVLLLSRHPRGVLLMLCADKISQRKPLFMPRR
jgi:putative Mn2+ efflux pump MntP